MNNRFSKFLVLVSFFFFPISNSHSQVLHFEDFNAGYSGWTINAGGSTGATNTWINVVGPYANSQGNTIGTLDGTPFMFVDDDEPGSGVTMIEQLVSPIVNTAGQPMVFLEFDQFYRFATTNEYGMVEVWDGVSWMVLDVYQGVNHGAFADPNHRVYDITAYNNAALQVRFTYDDGGEWGWYWGIDNFTIRVADNFDGNLASVTQPSEYSMIPTSQEPPGGFILEGVVGNQGISTITSVQLGVTVFKDGLFDSFFSNSTPSISSLNSLNLNAGTFYSSGVGDYALQYVVSIAEPDNNNINDTLWRYFSVSDSVFARDQGLPSGGIGFGVGGDGEFGNSFTLTNADILSSISVSLTVPTIGDSISANLYSFSGSPGTLIASTETTLVSISTTGEMILDFPTDITLVAGSYFIAVKDFNTNDNISAAYYSDIYTPGTSFYQSGTGGWIPLETAGYPFPMGVKMNFKQGTSNNSCVNNIAVGPASNLYTILANETNPVSAKNAINTITYLHRSDLNIYGGSSGHLRYDISTDGGGTWLQNSTLLNPASIDGTNAARYPNAGIYNPIGNIDPNNAFLSLYCGTVGASGWGDHVSGAISLGGGVPTETYNQAGIAQNLYPRSLVEGTPGTQWAVDFIYNGTNVTGFKVLKGSWNGLNDMVWAQVYSGSPALNTTYDGLGRLSSPNIGFDPSGQNGWISLLGHLQNGPVEYAYNPIFYRTTDGGLTWSGPETVNLNSFDCITSNITPGNIATSSFQSDLTVDQNGNPHLLIALMNSQNNYSVMGGEWHAMYDITKRNNNWVPIELNTVQAFSHTWGITPDDSRMDLCPQISRTEAGDKIFYLWTDSDTTLTFTGDNGKPNLFGKAYDIPSETFTLAMNFTSCNPLTNELILFPHAAPTVMGSTGNYDIPVVYAEINPSGSIIQSTNFIFLDSVPFQDSDFFIPFCSIPVSITTNTGTTQICSGNDLILDAGVGSSFLWSTGDTTQTITISNPGTYSVEVFGGCCQSQGSIIITNTGNPPVISLVSFTDEDCGLANGTATVSGSGGSGFFAYQWSTTPAQTTATVTGLSAGTYGVYLIDMLSMCYDTMAVSISSNGGPTVIVSNTTDENCGLSNGSATVGVSGGVSPYVYSWNTTPPQTSATASGLAAGSYIVTVTDFAGCISIQTATIFQIGGINLSMNHADEFCEASDGQVTANVTGGSGNYDYVWNTFPVQTTQTITGLSAGYFEATVTDQADGCIATFGVTLTNNGSAVLGSIMGNDATCGSTDGDATVFLVPGGSGLYSYSWNTSPPQTTPTASNLAPGTYTVVAMDQVSGCSYVDSISISSVGGPSVSINNFQNAYCGNSNGTATAQGTGGSGSYSYSWGTVPVTNGQTIANVPAGIYDVTVTDMIFGCTTIENVSIDDLPGHSVSLQNVSDETCGSSNGTASVFAVGGTGPFTYLWNTVPSQTTANATGLTAGVYQATISDQFTGCTSVSSLITVGDIAGPMATANVVDATCGLNDGSVTVFATNGSGSYTYTWNTVPPQTTATANNVGAGSYDVTIQDLVTGCSIVFPVSVNSVGGPNVMINSQSDADCGQDNGTATVSGTGGSGSFSYQWGTNPVQTTQTATNLLPGSYSVTVTDLINTCSSVEIITINDVPGPSSFISSYQDASCGNPTGSASVDAVGGSGGFTFEWSTSPAQFGQSAQNLLPGAYSVTLTDISSGCTSSSSVTVGNISAPTAMVTPSNATCGYDNGNAMASATGGTGSYTYLWNTSPAQTSQSAINLAPGSYSVTVTDQVTSCSDIQTTVIGGDPFHTSSVSSQTDAACGLNDGTATVSTSGGSGSFSYEWSSTPSQFGQTATGLSAGTYFVTVTDQVSGCVQVNSATISNVNAASLFFTAVESATCDNNNGTATVNTSGGGGGFSFQWSTSPIQTSPTAVGLLGGTYYVTVTDMLGCQSVQDVSIGNLPAPVASITQVVDATCSMQNGVAVSSVSGGVGSPTYLWNVTPVQTTANATGLAPGYVELTVTDAIGCTATVSAVIGEVPVHSISISNFDDEKCGLSDGWASVSVSGGFSPFSFLWDSNPIQTTSTATGLSAGTYSITVTDFNTCEVSTTVTIGEEAGPGLSLLNSTEPSCNGGNDGTAMVDGSGGLPPYEYAWDNGEMGLVANNLEAGNHTVSVTDQNGCVETMTLDITEPDAISIGASSSAEHSGQGDGSATANPIGGSAPYDYSWNTVPVQTTATALNLVTGSYTVTVTDNNGCESTETVNVSVIAGTLSEIEGSFLLYPNPSKGEVFIEFPEENSPELLAHLYDSKGLLVEVVHLKLVSKNKAQINLGNYSDGIYNLVLTINETPKSFRLKIDR